MASLNRTLVEEITQAQIRVTGVVQGVGFRPFVWRLARELDLKGRVINDSEGVLIDAWGKRQTIEKLVERISTEHPPLAIVETVSIEFSDRVEDCVQEDFVIAKSSKGNAKTGVSVDAATCHECVEDIFDPRNRRYLYPFTNCTNCGPRLTIVKRIPYDRSNTCMSVFELCKKCQAEYDDPLDRRFHAQPNACCDCGPQLELICLKDGSRVAGSGVVASVIKLIKEGKIVAVKALGGYQLLCDATSKDTVQKLRSRKRRDFKPLALMARDIEVVSKYVILSEIEKNSLLSHTRPIVIVNNDRSPELASGIAPGVNTLGFMLPSNPLYHLIMNELESAVVCTSGNLSDEPQCIDDCDAKERLHEIADYILANNRDIVNRVDDSIVRVIAGRARTLRRGRGLAPESISLPEGFARDKEILAMGAELKNTVCLVKDGQATLSQHIGDLKDARTYEDYRHNLGLYKNLYEHNAQVIVVDEHPEYLSSKLGKKMADAENDLELLKVQHHHAHIAACMVENKLPLDSKSVLGIALDGLGYSEEGLWGGEFLLSSYRSYRRLATFKPVALIGGNKAMYEPWRNTYAHILAYMGWEEFRDRYSKLELKRFFETKPLDTINGMLKSGLNSPNASSCGRLFDAVAAAVGICREQVQYEGQAAMQLEAIVDHDMLAGKEEYSFAIESLPSGIDCIVPGPMWQALFDDLAGGTLPGVIAARFHKGLAGAIVLMVEKLSSENEFAQVALSGGVFQNKVLTELVIKGLESSKHKVLTHSNIPANDGGIALGQAVVASARLSTDGGKNLCV